MKVVVDEKRYKREYDELITKEFKTKFGSDMNITLEKVKEIEKAPSGKYVFVKRFAYSDSEVRIMKTALCFVLCLVTLISLGSTKSQITRKPYWNTSKKVSF